LRVPAQNFLLYEESLLADPDYFCARSEKVYDRWHYYESETSYYSDSDEETFESPSPPRKKPKPKPKQAEHIELLRWDTDQEDALAVFYAIAKENAMSKPNTLQDVRSLLITVADPWIPMTADEEREQLVATGQVGIGIVHRYLHKKPLREPGTIARWRAAKHTLHRGCHSPIRAWTEEEHDAYWARIE